MLSLAGVDIDQLPLTYPFDGYDLSHWLIYGDENDNTRTNVGLSINKWNVTEPVSSNTGPNAIVFYSTLTNHRYKMVYGDISSNNNGYCQYCTRVNTGIKYRCETDASVNGTHFLYDLTLDFNETTNIYYSNNISEDASSSYYVYFKHWIEENNKTKEYMEKKDKTLLNSNKNKNNSSSSVLIIKEIWDYFLFSDSLSVVEQLWNEGKSIAVGYSQSQLFNQYSECQAEYFLLYSNPSLFDGAYTPWWEFDDYVEKMEEYCADGIYNQALFDLYTTLYSQ